MKTPGGYRWLIMSLGLWLGWGGAVPPARGIDWKKAVVSLEITGKNYDYFQPWNIRVRQGRKTGVVLEGRRILTTAQGLNDLTLVRVRTGGRGRWANAEVEWVDYHANVAAITVEEEGFWKETEPVPLAAAVPEDEPLQVLRWNQANFEVRRAEFDRYLVDTGALSMVPHLHLQITNEAKNLGGSEILATGDRLVGLLVDQSDNEARALPPSFLRAVWQGHRGDRPWRGLGYFDFWWQPGENPDLNRYLGYTGDEGGVVVHQVPPHPEGKERILRRLDLILKVDGFSIDVHGDYEDPDHGHLMLENLSSRGGKQAGDTVKIEIWRKGQRQTVDYQLPRAAYENQMVPMALPDQEPEFMLRGGLVFQPLTEPYLQSWGSAWKRRAPFTLVFHAGRDRSPERPGLVVLSTVLPDPINLGYQDQRFLLVDQVNGVPVSNLKDLEKGFRSAEMGVHRIDFLPGFSPRRMVLDAEGLQEATQRILSRYGIPTAQRMHP